MDAPFSVYKGSAPFVFVCYSHENEADVYPELEWLHAKGVRLWYDEGISTGRVWRTEIAEAIDRSQKVLFYISKASLASPHCNREINYALDKGLEIMPVYLEQIELTPDLRVGLNRIQALYQKKDAKHRKPLLQALVRTQPPTPEGGLGLRDSPFTVGEWQLIPKQHKLIRHDQELSVQPKTMDVLVFLAEHAGRIVSGEQLLRGVWGNAVVTDDSIYQHINRLRVHLGDDPKAPEYIQTVPRRGYRLIADVAQDDPVDNVVLASKWRNLPVWIGGAAAGLALIVGVFQLVYVDRSPDFDLSVGLGEISIIGERTKLQPVATALREDLIRRLTQFPELRFFSDSWPPEVDDAGTADSPTYQINGSVQAASDGVRVRVQLVRRTDNQTFWSDQFNGTVDNGLEELTTTVSRFVRLQLIQDHSCESIRRKTNIHEAGETACDALEVQFRIQHYGGFDPQLLLTSAKRAVDLDPELPEAHWQVGVGFALLGQFGLMPWKEASMAAHAALDKALEIEPDNAVFLWQKGSVMVGLDLNYQQANELVDRAVTLGATHHNARLFHASLGRLALRRGRLEESLEHYARAVSLFDADARIYQDYANALNYAGRYEEVLQVSDAGLQLVSSGYWHATLLLQRLRAYVALGETELAEQQMELVHSFTPIIQPTPSWVYPQDRALLGDHEEARRILAGLETMKNPKAHVLALGYAALMDYDEAFKWLKIAIEDHRYRYGLEALQPRVNPLFYQMRLDPRWDSVIQMLEDQENDIH